MSRGQYPGEALDTADPPFLPGKAEFGRLGLAQAGHAGLYTGPGWVSSLGTVSTLPLSRRQGLVQVPF